MRKIKNFKFSSKSPLGCGFWGSTPLHAPKLPLYSLKDFQGIAGRRDAHQRYPHNHPDQPAPHTATDSRTDRRAGAFPQAHRERHLPEIYEGAHALKESTPLTPLHTPQKHPTYMPKFMEQPRKHFYPFRHLLKMHFVHIWQNSHLSDAHIKRIFSSALCESALFEKSIPCISQVCTIMQIFTPGNTINRLVRSIFLHRCT